jgi:folate-dependent phosphoribosylglycinamide formyltransferase PurN
MCPAGVILMVFCYDENMGIVFITVPGSERQSFGNELHKRTGEGIDLVVVQNPKSSSFLKRLGRLYCRVGFFGFPKELWYAVLLRVNGARRVLGYFRARTESSDEGYVPAVLEVESVNSDEVYKTLRKISPELMVIWGSTILEPRILRTTKKAINLHIGNCPYYRGALANQHAVLLGDFRHIGATIHYAKEKVDSGEILASLTADTTMKPRDMFCDLNDRITELYIEIATKIFKGEEVPTRPQNKSRTKNLLLRQWIPSVRYKVGKKLLKREKEMSKIKENGYREILTKS